MVIETHQFKQDSSFEDSIKLGLIDDEVKAMNFEITAAHWTYFSELLAEVLN